jgi:tetratricopeptide (TPR) repeat protein
MRTSNSGIAVNGNGRSARGPRSKGRLFQSLNRAAAVLFLFQALLPSFAAAQSPASWIDSAAARYADALNRGDRALLEKTAETISRRPAPERGGAKALLLLGVIYWHLENLAYSSDDDGAVERWGVKAVDALNEAENAKADVYLTASHKAFASQILAGLGMLKAMKWGPFSGDELKKAQKANPQGYFTLLADAVNSSQAPPFAGGDIKRAIRMFEKLSKDFPDSLVVKIHLADAYARTNRRDEARALISPIVKSNPSNLFAAKVAAKLKD